MDLQFVVAVCELPDVDGVVEVAGGFAVDGDDGEIAVVAAWRRSAAGSLDSVIFGGRACASSITSGGKRCGR